MRVGCQMHLHLALRYKGDGLRLRFGSHYWQLPERSTLEEAGKQIHRDPGSAPARVIRR